MARALTGGGGGLGAYTKKGTQALVAQSPHCARAVGYFRQILEPRIHIRRPENCTDCAP